jgi:hypothetical protein
MLARPLPSMPASSNEAATLVERQLGRVRRRRNAFLLQRALYETLALGAAFGIGLVGLAFVLAPLPYAIVAWSTTAAGIAFLVHVARRTRAGWLGADAPVVVDRAAALDARLATFVAFASRPITSRLWPLLVRQNVEALERWSPERITPRAMPRTFWLALVSLAALAATFLVVLPEGASDGGFLPRPEGAGAPPEEPRLGELPPGSDGESALKGPLVDWSAFLASLPEQIREEILRRARRAPPNTEPPPGSKPAGRGLAKSAAAGGANPSGEDAKGEARAGQGTSDATDLPPPPMEVAPRDRPRLDEGAPPPEPAAKGDGLKMLGGDPDQPGLGASPGAGGPGAGSGSGGAEGLFGAAEESGGASGVFSLDLEAERGEGGAGEEDEDASRPASPLAAEQRLDDAIRRAKVPAAYEKIVERLFRRPDDVGAREREPEGG